MKLGSLFDGSGGFPLAGAMHGITPVWASEIEPYPIKVTKARFPGMKHLGSVLDVNGAEVEPVDIITFGSPCQDLSVAGKQAGLHKGERSNLFFEAIRIIKEMRESTDGKHPRIAVWENVPGAYSSNKGEDFRAVLKAFCSVKDEAADVPRPASGKWNRAGAIVGNGWSIAWRTFDAQFWGVPQRRKRIYLIADFGSERAGEILFEPESVRRDSAQSGTAGEGTADNAEGSAGRGYECLTPWDVQSRRVHDDSGAWPAIYGGEGGGHGYVLRQATPADAEGSPRGSCECLTPWDVQSQRIYGVDGVYPTIPANSNGGQNRQAICFQACGDRDNPSISTSEKAYCIPANPMSDRGQAICFQQNQRDEVRSLGEKTGAIAANSGAHQTNYVCSFMGGQGSRARSIAWTEEATPPLKSVPSGSNTVPDVCYPINTMVATRWNKDDNRTTFGIGEPGDPQFTLGAAHEHAVCYAFQNTGHGWWNEGETAQTLRTPCGGDSTKANLVVTKSRRYIIRRLTPLECCRLQGFPDWWCDDLVTDEPTDEDMVFWREVFETHRKVIGTSSKPKTDAQIVKWLKQPRTDSAEYKMWGNGIALPNAEYVVGCAKRLMEKREVEG